MSLIGKEPVQNPCEAETFDEAFRKNRARIVHERGLAQSLRDEMEKDGDPNAESVSPVFWNGMAEGNAKAFLIYEEEMKAAREKIAERLKTVYAPPASPSPVFTKGWESAVESWTKAVESDDPSIIVYW